MVRKAANPDNALDHIAQYPCGCACRNHAQPPASAAATSSDTDTTTLVDRDTTHPRHSHQYGPGRHTRTR